MREDDALWLVLDIVDVKVHALSFVQYYFSPIDWLHFTTFGQNKGVFRDYKLKM